jgi:hypothetical protein
MRRGRWTLIFSLGLGACVMAGCLRLAVPPQTYTPQSRRPSSGPTETVQSTPSAAAASDYLLTSAPSVRLEVQTTAAVEKTPDKASEKTSEAKPVEKFPKKSAAAEEMRIASEESSSPPRPADPQPRMEVHPAPLTRPDAPSVQVLRGLVDHLSEEEINEQLKSYDPVTREAMLHLLSSVVQLQDSGGIKHMTPRNLAAWLEGLDTLSASLRGRAQLILDRLCFCSYIKNFGDFAPLPPEHAFFQPGEVTHIYVQVRNFSSRRQQDRYLTVVKGRLDIYDENNRKTPPITWISTPRQDVSAAPRQDYYINFRFPVPPTCPSGLYTMRITVEDWTDAPPDAKQVPESRMAQRTIDFRVGGPVARPARAIVTETSPP